MTSNSEIKINVGEKLKDRIVNHNHKYRKEINKKINVSKTCREAIEKELEIKEAQ